jgi:hypothetical protein
VYDVIGSRFVTCPRRRLEHDPLPPTKSPAAARRRHCRSGRRRRGVHRRPGGCATIGRASEHGSAGLGERQGPVRRCVRLRSVRLMGVHHPPAAGTGRHWPAPRGDGQRPARIPEGQPGCLGECSRCRGRRLPGPPAGGDRVHRLDDHGPRDALWRPRAPARRRDRFHHARVLLDVRGAAPTRGPRRGDRPPRRRLRPARHRLRRPDRRSAGGRHSTPHQGARGHLGALQYRCEAADPGDRRDAGAYQRTATGRRADASVRRRRARVRC